jgi:outer membrane receptor for ferrienterochelin and colicins
MDKPLEGVSLSLPALGKGCLSDTAGIFRLSAPPGKYVLKASLLGFKPSEKEVEVAPNASSVVNFELEEDMLHLNAVVVTGSRLAESIQKSLVPISSISRGTFDLTQALNLAEGVNFSPGLRLENNCQNCGFTQLRMLGLSGAYSQILINSRPIFSALAGVYGLEMLPANMIERVEVIRGGGLVMYGSNAIAGTVNIITQEPSSNSFEVSYNQAFTQFQIPDRTVMVNGSWASPELDKGMHFYAYTRDRNPFDANGDGFSEIPILKNTTLGMDAYWNTPGSGKLKIGGFYIQEFRRGGNRFEYAPHQADIAEQLNHRLLGANLSYEKFSSDLKHKWSFYASAQGIERNSYYGGGGRVLNPGDSLLPTDILASNAYGNTQDFTAVSGLQYFFEPNQRLRWLLGGEYQYNSVQDQMPGYKRAISQSAATAGAFTQLQYRPLDKLTLAAGARLDIPSLKGNYDFEVASFQTNLVLIVPVPKLSAMYELTKQIKVRGTYTQGYRAPQTFNEDLHIETVGGAARFIQLLPNLKPERSYSFFTSLQYSQPLGKINFNFLLEGFYTDLHNPFILSAPLELPSGVSVIEKRNGEGAAVKGFNTEVNAAFTAAMAFTTGRHAPKRSVPQRRSNLGTER